MSHPTPEHPAASDRTPAHRYTASYADAIERRWQSRWDADATFRTPNPGEPGFDASRPKFYCLDMFPYPSGAGLHVGHPEGYTATDILSRYKRMKGCNVLHPMGWDAFGLPAEQYAIQTGIHPAITTKQSIDNFRRQLKRFGFSYDWSREVGTIDPEYYRWTQWIFLKLYDSWYDPTARGGKGGARPIAELTAALERGMISPAPDGSVMHLPAQAPQALGGGPVGLRRWTEMDQHERRDFIDGQRLAYIGEQTVNWCPALGTALANDEVIDGRSERGGHPVLRKPLRQWMFRITAYTQRLLDDLEPLDWPESTKTMQREWIGRSEGAEIDFGLVDAPGGVEPFLRVFTTRPDTIFGATYMVVAPEHPLVDAVRRHPRPKTNITALVTYIEQARNRSDIERQESKDKTGVFTGVHAVNPATGQKIPVWTADYVLMGYGTGAIMAVPAHDERDYEFAKAFGLPIRDVIYPRLLLAMQFYSAKARHLEHQPEAWVSTLADFLGLAVSRSSGTDEFDALLTTVKARRDEEHEPWHAAVELLLVDAAAGSLSRRGSTKAVWLEAIEELGLHRPEELRQRFEGGTFYSAAGNAYSGPGTAVNSSGADVSIDGLGVDDAKKRLTAWLEKSGRGTKRVNFRLRDWTFSRQRYWGEPFPIVFDDQGRHYPVSESALPVTLPPLDDYAPVESPDPQPLLAKATSWVRTTAGAAGVSPDVLDPETPVTRETNTMPGSAGSSWYFLRYTDAHNSDRFASRDAERYWIGGIAPESSASLDAPPAAMTHHRHGGVDFYLGGSEHAVGHLLYSRFWHKVLFDLGEVSTPEPFQRLYHQGLITSFAYQRSDKSLVAVDAVDEREAGVFVERSTGARLTQVTAKMSKSLKNVVNPDDVIAEFGADTFRLYEMYMGPLDISKPWNPRDISGLFRFLQRLWRIAVDEETGSLRLLDAPDEDLDKQLHRTTAKVGDDIERLAFNTAIAAMIEFVNAATAVANSRGAALSRPQLERLALVIAPFVPHIAEELWSKLGHASSLTHEPWPLVDSSKLRDDSVELPVQIQGKVRARIVVASDADESTIRDAAMADERVIAALAGKSVKKVIVVPGRMVNIVAG